MAKQGGHYLAIAESIMTRQMYQMYQLLVGRLFPFKVISVTYYFLRAVLPVF